MNSVEPFRDHTEGEAPVEGFLHRASGPAGEDVLVLTHGAGGNCHSPLLVALGEAFAQAGVTVLRCNLPFRQRRPHGPPSASAKMDQEGLRRAALLVQHQTRGRVFLGGHSYGGRQASMLAAADASVAQALLLLSYPLHPPGKPQQLRAAHLPNLRVPVLFVSGTKDPFGTIAEIDSARSLIPALTEMLAIAGAGHSLLTKRNQEELVASIVRAFLALTR